MATRLTLAEVKKRLSAFARTFKNAENEQREASIFWTRFYECYGIRAEEATIYEQQVKKISGGTGRIDSFIPGLLIVEHKSKGKSLDAAYEQASDYFLALPSQERPKFIITSDFAHIRLYDLAKKEQHECTLQQLPAKASWFKFLLGDAEVEITEETPINRNAAYQISKIHEALLRAKFKGRDLEVFMTRLLFCMFADDTGVFGENNLLRKLIENTREDGADLGAKLTELFDVFDQAESDRQTTLDEALAVFPYVNGALFRERTRIPTFDSDLRQLLIDCVRLDWSDISPAIFGAMFQGVLEEHEPDSKRQATRRELGAHYTSERNILRVINPLFMDDLRAELASAKRSKPKLQALYDKLPKLNFFDPACGCGNFLVIAYREVRRLEFEVIAELFNFEQGRGLLDVSTLCRVQLTQFYGIEIDEAAAHIARVALYITDHQLNTEAAERFGTTRATVPLTHTPNIVCGNAIRTEWNSVLPANECSYIISNPPFVGKTYQTKEQKQDVLTVFDGVKSASDLDYVACWYGKAAQYIEINDRVEVAFVSTNSITQGEQPAVLWSQLLKHGIVINFAHKTFRWNNEGKGVASVHCVIVGFAKFSKQKKRIFVYNNGIDKEPDEVFAKQINAYLVDAASSYVVKLRSPLSKLPPISYGNKPTDDGNFIFTTDEKDKFLASEPSAAKYFRRFIGAIEFINNKERWCLWLKDVEPQVIRSMPLVVERVKKVREFRLASTAAPTREAANKANEFFYISQPIADYLAIPETSSENRDYLPIGYISKDVIASNLLWVVPNATKFDFAILTSSMHMAWMKAICGRLESRYRYTGSLIYNTFPIPIEIGEREVAAIVSTADAILASRSKYPSASFADLYDNATMPFDLRKAHEANNKAVDKAYGYKGTNDDAARVAFLFKLYEEATSLLPKAAPKRKAKSVV